MVGTGFEYPHGPETLQRSIRWLAANPAVAKYLTRKAATFLFEGENPSGWSIFQVTY
jgi:hypothetical protein